MTLVLFANADIVSCSRARLPNYDSFPNVTTTVYGKPNFNI